MYNVKVNTLFPLTVFFDKACWKNTVFLAQALRMPYGTNPPRGKKVRSCESLFKEAQADEKRAWCMQGRERFGCLMGSERFQLYCPRYATWHLLFGVRNKGDRSLGLAVTSRTVEKQILLLTGRSWRLRTVPWNLQYIELVTHVSGILLVYFTENNEFHDAQV